MRCGTNDSQRQSEDYQLELDAFCHTIASTQRHHQIETSNIFNMDQTMVRFDMPHNRTNNTRGEHHIRITNTGGVKRGFTVALCASAAGVKLPAMIIFKERSGVVPLCVLTHMRIPINIRVRATVKGWMTTPELHSWIDQVWGDCSLGHRMIVLDQYRPHHTESTLRAFARLATTVIGIPGGM
jgi:hypothetical protein